MYTNQQDAPELPAATLPGLRGLDHVGITVPDINEAHRYLVDVLGFEHLYSLGPFDKRINDRLGVGREAAMRELRFYRIGAAAVLEVFDYEAPERRTEAPANSDVGGHHIALYVEDLDVAMATLADRGVEFLGGPTTSAGPSEGQRWVYFRAPWGLTLELVSYPGGKAFQRNRSNDLLPMVDPRTNASAPSIGATG